MWRILTLISKISEVTILITPFTLVFGIINGIKKPKKEATPYIIMAIISAYLIIIPLLYY